MPVLTSQQRGTLETAVKQARKLAETGARNALHSLAVDHQEPFSHMSPDQRALRNRLRHKARLLGDDLPATGNQQIDRLGYELAYENWHKMLFAKFLESNGLLMHPSGVAITMEECEELAREEEFIDKWDAAATYASKMLPAIFRTDDPLMQIQFAADDRIKLEAIIDALDSYIFTADDALGWVYQFWQSDAKAAINASGDKIDGAKLPAVTQLFTEPYMVHFLIDNTLGAWWVSRNPGVTPPVKFEYLRLPDNVPPASSRSNKVDRVSSWSDNSQIGSLNYYNPYEEVIHVKGNLPHWRQEGKLYFVTFRTADSMPQKLLKEWESEMDAWKSQNPEPHTPEQKKEYYRRFPAKMQEYLDAGHGACHLKDEKIKIVVENALRFFNGDRYDLDEYVVAGNHVHVLVEPRGNHQLSEILHSWKSFTANEIHKITNESGAFWQKESFDHLVRSEASLEKFREYIRKHSNSHNNSAISGGENNLRQDSNSAISGGENTHRQDSNSAILAEKESNNNLRQDAGVTLAFPGWPNKTSEVTSLDPCMGSGHFVASLFPVFAALRMYEEGLTKEEATDKVITENLHGLELDARCTQIAAFNLALTAWKFCGHYKQLPEMNLACSGIAPKGKVEDWVKLVGKVDRDDQERMENGMRMLYDHFQLAPELGSLLDPSTLKADAFTASFEQLQPVLAKALEGEADKDLVERGVMAAGIAKAGEILAQKYNLLITNVPYLQRKKQGEILAKYSQINYPDSKTDLATVFIERTNNLIKIEGTLAIVSPANWISQDYYKKFRMNILNSKTINFIVQLGAGSFSQITGEVVKPLLYIHSNAIQNNIQFSSLDTSICKSIHSKVEALISEKIVSLYQAKQKLNPDNRFSLNNYGELPLLQEFVNYYNGITTGDILRFSFSFWEPKIIDKSIFQFFRSTLNYSTNYGGCEGIIKWENGNGSLLSFVRDRLGEKNISQWIRTDFPLNTNGIIVSAMGKLPVSIFSGTFFDDNTVVILSKREDYLPAIWEFCSSKNYSKLVREIDNSLKVRGPLVKVPFDLEYWQKVADEKYPNGLPKPYSDDATQWLFHGHPIKAENPLQVAIARLLGYRWPAENVQAASSSLNTNTTSSGLNNNAAGSSVYDTLADEAKELINQIKAFDHLTDEDGIFCIPSVNAEEAGADRLRAYLQEVFGSDWNNQTISQLLTKVEAASSSLEDYLRKEFFAQHCKLFQNRPFIWHIWDGRSDGFSALVNYHKLTKENLNKLIYTYLGDWIRMCDAKKKAEESGAEGLLSAALKLKEKLEAILQGEAPYDIFVRWKPLSQQPLGWDPDLNDGVRLNIRPFVEAGVLRSKFNIKWGIDRGKNPPGSPWGEVRDNDRHLSLEKKREARENKSQ